MVEQNTTRRDFLSKLWTGIGFVALLQLIGGALLFLSSKQMKSGQKKEMINAGSVNNFKHNSMTHISNGQLYISRLKNGGFLALSKKCTHLGCAVPWVAEHDRFECPCHTSFFDAKGNVLKAPATRALDLYSIEFKNGDLWIDISKPIKRSQFSDDQVVFYGT